MLRRTQIRCAASQISVTPRADAPPGPLGETDTDLAMSKYLSSIAAAAVLALSTMTSAALAQGYGYGSTGAAASSLGFTASPPIALNSNVPIVAPPAAEPATTGSVARRDQAWTRLHRR
ncbi:hypothetical protein GCM10007887_26270 [Methylobacterium haplocladii]|uniref:Uncharacterized protein n=2 Tax=Methylobacterium haplocladii TaxID=1176176 RepID=A0A512IV77_9HYPH|nr:hypothetical protein MHA02_40090 [Methylobacterium haplocladii]GLS59953.1 hypothetical protein GCM10007887_26270 [Methylobacterium haplocladii]